MLAAAAEVENASGQPDAGRRLAPAQTLTQIAAARTTSAPTPWKKTRIYGSGRRLARLCADRTLFVHKRLPRQKKKGKKLLRPSGGVRGIFLCCHGVWSKDA